MSKEKDGLGGLGFDTFNSAEEFMNASDIVAEETVEDILDDAAEAGGEGKNNTKDEAKKQAELEREVFGDWETGEVSEEEEEIPTEETETAKDKPTVTTANPNKTALEHLKAKGFVDYTSEEGVEIPEDKALELIEEGWEASISKEIDEIIKDLPEEGKGLLKIASKGGDVKEYLKTLVVNATSPINKDTDMTVEENQVLALETDMKENGYDSEYIETHIQTLKDTGKLEGMAAKAAAKIIKTQTDAEAKAVVDAATSEAARKEGIKATKLKVQESLAKVDNLNGLVFNAQDKKDLPDYMTVPAVQLQDGRVITQQHHDLFVAMADPEKNLLLAKLIKSNFDFASITDATKTAYSKDIKGKVENAKQGKDKEAQSSGSSQKPVRSLAERLA